MWSNLRYICTAAVRVSQRRGPKDKNEKQTVSFENTHFMLSDFCSVSLGIITSFRFPVVVWTDDIQMYRGPHVTTNSVLFGINVTVTQQLSSVQPFYQQTTVWNWKIPIRAKYGKSPLGSVHGGGVADSNSCRTRGKMFQIVEHVHESWIPLIYSAFFEHWDRMICIKIHRNWQ